MHVLFKNANTSEARKLLLLFPWLNCQDTIPGESFVQESCWHQTTRKVGAIDVTICRRRPKSLQMHHLHPQLDLLVGLAVQQFSESLPFGRLPTHIVLVLVLVGCHDICNLILSQATKAASHAGCNHTCSFPILWGFKQDPGHYMMQTCTQDGSCLVLPSVLMSECTCPWTAPCPAIAWQIAEAAVKLALGFCDVLSVIVDTIDSNNVVDEALSPAGRLRWGTCLRDMVECDLDHNLGSDSKTKTLTYEVILNTFWADFALTLRESGMVSFSDTGTKSTATALIVQNDMSQRTHVYVIT